MITQADREKAKAQRLNDLLENIRSSESKSLPTGWRAWLPTIRGLSKDAAGPIVGVLGILAVPAIWILMVWQIVSAAVSGVTR